MLKGAPRSRYSGTTVEALILSSQGTGHVRARHTELSWAKGRVSAGIRAPRTPDNQSDARRLESGRGGE